MKQEQKIKQSKIITDLINKYESQRAFSRVINEDPADVIKWRNAAIAIHVRAALTLIRLFDIDPHVIRPDLFAEGTKILFKEKA